MQDAAEVCTDFFSPGISGQFKAFMFMTFIDAAQGTHTLSIDVRALSSDNITVRRLRMLVIKR